MTELLTVRELGCSYGPARRRLGIGGRTRTGSLVVRDVSFTIPEGATVGLVGESGSGKTTLAAAIAGILTPRQGRVALRGETLPPRLASRSRSQLRDIQYVFQNPDSSLNPRQRVSDIIGRPLTVFEQLRGQARALRVAELLDDVQLDPGYADRFPAQLSGGERQRVAIARALAARPKLLLCDEILTALDVSVQKRILDLLRALQRERGLTYLFVSHDLAAVRALADQVMVLHQGEIAEEGPPDRLFSQPAHPYTRLLVDSIPQPGRK